MFRRPGRRNPCPEDGSPAAPVTDERIHKEEQGMGKKYAVRNELSEERRQEIRDELLRAAGDETIFLVSEQDILQLVKAEPEEFGSVLHELDEMEREGKIVKSKKGRYMLPEAYELFAGKLRGHRRGFAFVTPDIGGEDVYIPRSFTAYALDGDRVLFRLCPETRGGKRAGKIEKILSRGVTSASGTYEAGKNYGLVRTDSRYLPDIYVEGDDTGEAVTGDKVHVRITQYPDGVSGTKGVITEIYGKAGDTAAETEAVMQRFDVRTEFPEEVMAEASSAPQKVTEVEWQGRVDLREKAIVTIDGEDARDFDDAVRAEKTKDGGYRLYVSIADVAEYVKEGSALDKEALNRGCSVYFPDRVCPMLPRELSNGICSLNEGEDRLTLTAEMEISRTGEVTSYRIYESVIRSAARLVYTDVSDLLEMTEPEVPENPERQKRLENLREKYRELLPMICDMRDLAEILSEKRYREGSIDFDVTETHITLDEEGNVASLEPAERRVANKMIEEFMLTANRVVAEHCYWMEIPFVYRVHDKPDQMKMEELKHFAGTLGFLLKGSCGNVHPKSICDLLQQAKGSDSENVISRVALRSMKKAVYDTECGGHFGLGFRYYCHFTSPIRRYPDLMVHRILKDTLHGTLDEGRMHRLKKLTEDAAAVSSARERAAVDAERAVEKKLRAVYMSRFIGARFDGIISGVAAAGFFVELENTAEGYVPAETLLDDYYIFDEKNYRMIGERTRRIFAVGDRVSVEVDKVSIVTDEIDLRLISDEEIAERTERRVKNAGGRRKRESSSREKRRSGKERKNAGREREDRKGTVRRERKVRDAAESGDSSAREEKRRSGKKSSPGKSKRHRSGRTVKKSRMHRG